MTTVTARSVFDAELPVLDYDLAETARDVHARLRAAQRVAPIAIGPLGPEVLGHELARAVLRDPRFVIPPGIHLAAQGVTSGPLWDRVIRSILCMEGEEHRRVRSLVSKAFTPRAITRLHGTIATIMSGLIDEVAAAGRCEVVADLARPYPIPVICALLGAPPSDWRQFSRWAEDIFKIVSFDTDIVAEQPVVLQAWDEFDAYVDGMIAERRRRLTDDLLSDLIRAEEDGDRLDAAELRMLSFSILIAGTDTTRAQFAACVQVLGEHPDQWAALRNRPELAMPAVEECMRHSPAVCSTLRMVHQDASLGGYLFPAGTAIMVNTFAANRDPAVYDEPERFDVERAAPPAILSFGGGAHYCLGANLARTELAEALKVLTARIPHPRSVVPAGWKPMHGMSGPTALHLDFDPEPT